LIKNENRLTFKLPNSGKVVTFGLLTHKDEADIDAEMKALAKQSEIKAAKVFMAGWSKAIDNGKSGLSAISAGNIALSRAGFAVGNSVATKRDRELWAMEDALLKQFENELSNEEKEQLEIVREHEKSQKKRK
jgi:hypothetical protein